MRSYNEYILTEKAKASDALRFMDYEKSLHSKISSIVRKELINKWEKVISKYEPIEIDKDIDNTKKNVKFNKLEIDKSNAKVGRFNGKVTVSPSIKIGNLYDYSTQDTIKRKLLAITKEVLKNQLPKLNKDSKGNPFYVSQEDGALGDIRMIFKTGNIKKTIFLVSTENAYKFDRVYIRNFLK